MQATQQFTAACGVVTACLQQLTKAAVGSKQVAETCSKAELLLADMSEKLSGSGSIPKKIYSLLELLREKGESVVSFYGQPRQMVMEVGAVCGQDVGVE